jgi:hypothetical protein
MMNIYRNYPALRFKDIKPVESTSQANLASGTGASNRYNVIFKTLIQHSFLANFRVIQKGIFYVFQKIVIGAG